MATPLDILKDALETELVDSDGEEFEIELLPPLSEDEIGELEGSLPCPLPAPILELLRFASGFEGGFTDTVDFAGRFAFGSDAFPHGLPIAADGLGNHWVVDLTEESTDFGPIYFACHDPPIIARQSASLSEFLEQLLDPTRTSTSPSEIELVHDQATMKIWKEDPGAIAKIKALASTDPILRAFASAAPDGAMIADLRNAPIGAGFSWGRFGPETHIQRHPTEPLFAYGPRKPSR